MPILEKILEEIEKIGKIQFSSYTKPLITVEDVIKIIRSHMEDDGWILADQPPKDNSYILLSFANFSLPMVGRYEENEHGDGAYYLGDCDGEDTCASQDLYVNAWQPLPEPYRVAEKSNVEMVSIDDVAGYRIVEIREEGGTK